MTSGACTICGTIFEFDETKRGRRRVQCSRACTNQAHRNRRSAQKQAQRKAVAKTCEHCGGPVPVPALGVVPRWCSRECNQISAGRVREVPLPPRVCALPECTTEFVPVTERTRCCCTNHGQILYNRESRADGRQSPSPWTDARRANWKKRQALKLGVDAEAFRFEAVFDRDGWLCGICSEPVDPALKWPDPLSVSLDHVVPLSKGGAHRPENAQCAHLVCNIRKGNRLAA